jgi:hypothetical protein
MQRQPRFAQRGNGCLTGGSCETPLPDSRPHSFSVGERVLTNGSRFETSPAEAGVFKSELPAALQLTYSKSKRPKTQHFLAAELVTASELELLAIRHEYLADPHRVCTALRTVPITGCGRMPLCASC